jgi:hypothetical protein
MFALTYSHKKRVCICEPRISHLGMIKLLFMQKNFSSKGEEDNSLQHFSGTQHVSYD